MKNIIKKIQNLVARLRKTKLSFQIAIILLLSFLMILTIVYALISSNNSSNSGLSVSPSGAVTTSTGEVVATFELSDELKNLNLIVVNIYVDDINNISSAQIKALKSTILKERGLIEKEVYINILQRDELGGRPTTQTADEGESFDILNPNSYDNAGDFTYLEDTTTGQDFNTYVGAVLPRTENFDIYKISENNFTVILKQGYTEEQFRTEYLNNFSGTDKVAITFKLQTEI